MIKHFSDDDTADLFENRRSRRWKSIESVALRKLDQLDASVSLNDLRIPPGNRQEALSSDRIGQHGIRINGQYRLCFVWTDDGVRDVEIAGYH